MVFLEAALAVGLITASKSFQKQQKVKQLVEYIKKHFTQENGKQGEAQALGPVPATPNAEIWQRVDVLALAGAITLVAIT